MKGSDVLIEMVKKSSDFWVIAVAVDSVGLIVRK